jgi:plasmid replication initiation protein
MKNKENNKPVLINSNNMAVQANRFIEARYKESLTFWESFLITKMCSMIAPEDVDFKPYKIYMREVIDFMELTPSGQVYSYIMDAAKRLLDRRIIIGLVDETGQEEIIETHIVTSVRRLREPKQDHNMYVTLTFLPELKPFLLQLHRDFTKLDMEIFKQLKTASSIRLYQIFKSHIGKSQHKIQFKLDDLKEILGVSEKYGLYAGFKMRVLDEAQKRLLEKTDISFTYEEKKEGKKVSTLIFHINNNKPEPKELTSNINLTQSTIIQRLEKEKENLVLEMKAIVVTQFGVSLKVFMALVEAHTEGEVRQAIQVTEKARQAGKVENSAGFFVNALKNHYQDAELQKKEDEAHKIAEKKAKAEAHKKAEAATQEQKQQAARTESHRRINIIKDLIQKDAPLIHQAITELQNSIFTGGYDPKKTIEANLTSAMFAGTLMNVLQKMKPSVFLG